MSTLSLWLPLRRAIFPAIVTGSVLLSLYWVFLVPIFQSPDEHEHLDYAFNIYSASRLITVRDAFRPDGDSHHDYTLYLAGVSSLNAVHNGAKMPADYGTTKYFQDLDQNAPTQGSPHWASHSRYLGFYPYGYYLLVALWMKLVSLFTSRLSVLFFGTRILSVILLACSLSLGYAVMRELRFTRQRAALLSAIIGFFPLTSFVSSYVQPDNLSLTLVVLCCYLGFRVRRRPTAGSLLLLGIALGLLCITKYHFYLVVAVSVTGMLIADRLTGRLNSITWRRLFACLLLPTLVLGSVQICVQWGSPVIGTAAAAGTETLDAAGRINYYLNAMAGAFGNFYLTDGTTFQSFWGRFGWFDTPLVIVSPEINGIIRFVIAFITVALFGLTILRVEQIATRLARIVRRGHWRTGLAIVFSNPLVNAYFVFTVIMFVLFALYRDFVGQGRNWFPFILPIFLVGIDFAPKALSSRKTQAMLSRLITAGLVVYCIVGGFYAIRSVSERFYGP
jgi:4-amino-4-deoxy-L-arabinose transferase-like glycosyltransferase